MFYRLPKVRYFKPRNLNEALELISKLSNFKLLAGGTDLVLDMKIGRVKPEVLVDIPGLGELKFIKDEGQCVRIGALTTLQEILESDIVKRKIPVLSEAVLEMASWQVRNVATLGGNLCNASPAADTAPPLLVLNSSVKLVSTDGERVVPISKFFLGPRKTVMEENEILAEVIVPVEEGSGTSFIKLGRRNAFTLSVVAVATLVKVSNGKFSDVRIALNSVAPKPLRAFHAEEFLKGKEVSLDNVSKASELVLEDISPIDDVRASARYRREMSVVLTKESLIKSLSKLGVEV